VFFKTEYLAVSAHTSRC